MFVTPSALQSSLYVKRVRCRGGLLQRSLSLQEDKCQVVALNKKMPFYWFGDYNGQRICRLYTKCTRLDIEGSANGFLRLGLPVEANTFQHRYCRRRYEQDSFCSGLVCTWDLLRYGLTFDQKHCAIADPKKCWEEEKRCSAQSQMRFRIAACDRLVGHTNLEPIEAAWDGCIAIIFRPCVFMSSICLRVDAVSPWINDCIFLPV